jgi:hypothetical protein
MPERPEGFQEDLAINDGPSRREARVGVHLMAGARMLGNDELIYIAAAALARGRAAAAGAVMTMIAQTAWTRWGAVPSFRWRTCAK